MIKTKGPKVFCPIRQQEVLVFPLVACEIKGWGPGILENKSVSLKKKISVSKGPRGGGGHSILGTVLFDPVIFSSVLIFSSIVH